MSTPSTRRLCFALDLHDDQQLIDEYIRHHRRIWPEITHSLLSAGIVDLSIYQLHTRLFMIMEVDDTFDAERKKELDESNPKKLEWEELMWRYQLPLPWARPGEKWMEMKQIFQLEKEPHE
jgi:L-rhamnose mutarotase